MCNYRNLADILRGRIGGGLLPVFISPLVIMVILMRFVAPPALILGLGRK